MRYITTDQINRLVVMVVDGEFQFKGRVKTGPSVIVQKPVLIVSASNGVASLCLVCAIVR